MLVFVLAAATILVALAGVASALVGDWVFAALGALNTVVWGYFTYDAIENRRNPGRNSLLD